MPQTLPRRGFLAASTAGVASTAFATGNSKSGSTDRPNLLFILTDQWRASAFGHGSDQVVRTPHLDQLGQQGAICSRAYAANPVCTPNRSCLLTGRHSHQTGMITNNLMLPPEEVCWPQIFADAGYQTHYIGKWHMDGTAKPGFVPPGWRRRGFNTFQGFNRGHVYHKPWGFDDDGSDLVPPEVAEAADYYEPTYQTDLAIRFMRRQQEQQQPFACYLSLGPPHTPFAPPRDFDLYKPGQIQLRPNVPTDHQAKARKELSGYYGLCESLDHEVGRLTTYLKSSGLADNTLVVFTADHGELAGSHGKYRKGEPEDESLRVPLIARWPGQIPAGTQVSSLISSLDMMPTLLSLCALPDPGTCIGTDMAAALRGQPDSLSRNSIYCEGKVNSAPEVSEGGDRPVGTADAERFRNSSAWRTLVTDRYKLTVRGAERHVEHLFDVINDPFEQHNLASDPAHQATVADLTDELLAHRDATQDAWPYAPVAAKQMYVRE